MWAQTQSLAVPQQLRAGVRVLDVRICDDVDGGVWVSHTFASSVPFSCLVADLREFLAESAMGGVMAVSRFSALRFRKLQLLGLL